MEVLQTGTIVQVTHVRSGHSFRALVDAKSDGDGSSQQLSFCRIERPYEKVRVALSGAVSWGATATKFALFILEPASAADVPQALAATSAALEPREWPVHLRSAAHQKKVNRDGTVGWYLGAEAGAADARASGLLGDVARGPASLFRLAVVSARGAFALDAGRMVFEGAFARAASALSESQRRSFMQNGYLQVRGAVSLALVDAALRRINHELGVPGRMVDGGVEEGSAKLAGNVSNSEEVLNLFHLSDARKYAEALVGAGKVRPPTGAQLALRFPELGEPREPRGTEWHTDGMRQGKRHPFSLLLGVALSDVREPLAGNLTVFPESHARLHALLTADGRLEGYADECFRTDSVWGGGTLPDLGAPVQLLASRGDIVLAHPTLAHRGGLNFSPDIRYQVYFRLKHVDHAALAPADLWADLDGLQELVAGAPPQHDDASHHTS
ncbi:hypothetical protein PybrP1_012661 [[Pythium] brassicae (nom. inval.)]|nr:hypothetical protein PybrP1_012661 [[Pythium] brassicae (nom. inval.)]